MNRILIFLLIAITSCTLKAQDEIASTFIQVFNQGSRVEVIDYLSNNMSVDRIESYGIDAHVGVFLNRQNTFGELKHIKSLALEKAVLNNNERVMVRSSNNKQAYILTINRTKNAPYKINYFTLQEPEPLATSTPLLSEGEISADDLTPALSLFLENLADKEAFSGAVLVAKGKQVLFKQAFGFANKQWQVNNTLDTRFSLGSMNKMFTAVAVLQLIEKNKLTFEDKLVDFVDKSWLPTGDVDNITVRQLLTHTSGLGNFFNDDFNKSNKEVYRVLKGYKPLIAKSPLLFAPGTRNRYSNSGMLMLGLIIEQVSGQNYYDYIQANIYDKADMPNSGSFELDSITPNLATGYLKRMHSDNWVNSVYTRAIKGSPAGGGFSTISDLHHFALALTQFELLGKKLTEAAYSEKTQYNSAPWYGYGISVDGDSDDRVIGHGGAYLGVDARLDIHLDSGFIVIILANQSDVVTPVRREVNALIKRMR